MAELTYQNTHKQGVDEPVGEAFERHLRSLRAEPTRTVLHRIGGETSEGGVPFEREDPTDATRIVTQGHEGDAPVVAAAVAAARAASGGWRSLSVDERLELFHRVRDRIAGDVPRLAALVSLETGKVRTEAVAEVHEAMALIDLYEEQIRRADGFRVLQRPPVDTAVADVVLRPYGVFGVIAPFNFPLAIPMTMAAAALLMGNTVVLKPSALTPSSGDMFWQLFAEAGFPDGVVNVVQGGGATGEALSEGALDGLAFTGSADVGLELMSRLVRPPYARPVLAEMGGKNPAIVTSSAGELEVAANAVVRSAFGLSGQKCNACSRVVVERGIHDHFVELLVAAAERLRVGDPIEATSFTGPLVSESALRRYERSVATADRDGRVQNVGPAGPGGGYYPQLTIVTGLPRGHALSREELFAPVLTVTPFDEFGEALEEANAVRYGLAAGLFSDDEGEQQRFLDEIQAGIVFVNNPGGATTGVWPGSQTMAGWKASGSTGKGGFGPWYLSQFGREQSRTRFGV